MKTMLTVGATLFALLFVTTAHADDYQGGCANNACAAPAGGDAGCPPDAPAGQEVCYKLYAHYEPCYYTTQRCVTERIPCKKSCTRQVPKYDQVQRCKMVPQYYTETVCRYETECYEVDDCKEVQKYVTDTHCKYVPKYYWKKSCDATANDVPVNNCAAPQGGCANGACGR